MRATAAEARLRNFSSSHAGPSSSVKLEGLPASPEDRKPDELDELDDSDEESYNFDNDVKAEEDVDDPHASAEERKREMEDEMDDEEMDRLRWGWEDFVSGSARPPGVKRERSVSPILKPAIKRKQENGSGSGFGGEMLKQEKARALGMQGSTLGRTDRTIGTKPSIKKSKSEEEPQEATRNTGAVAKNGGESTRRFGEWACALCTYVNLADHGRCGE